VELIENGYGLDEDQTPTEIDIELLAVRPEQVLAWSKVIQR
jgi:hypothetical protein